MSTNSLPSKMISAAQVKTCMKCEYFFFMWFQFSCDTLTKSVKLLQGIYLARRHVSTKDTKVKNTVRAWRKQRLAIGIDQSERVFMARPNWKLDSFICFRYAKNICNRKYNSKYHRNLLKVYITKKCNQKYNSNPLEIHVTKKCNRKSIRNICNRKYHRKYHRNPLDIYVTTKCNKKY